MMNADFISKTQKSSKIGNSSEGVRKFQPIGKHLPKVVPLPAVAARWAGAKTQMLTQWPVNSAATRDFMVRFYTKLAAGSSKGDAWLETQRDYIRGGGPSFLGTVCSIWRSGSNQRKIIS